MENVTNEVASVEVAPITEVAALVVASEPVAAPVVTPEAPVSKPKRARKPKAEAKPVKAKKTVKAEVKAKKTAKVEVKRGRPIVFKGEVKRQIVSVIRKHGLTAGRQVLAQKNISISLPTLGKFAAEAGIQLHRGRLSKAA